MAIRALDNITSRNLHSGQVIIDLEAIVKELVENALDAQSTSIEVKLFDNGVEAIHVKDNGKGITEVDRPVMAKRYHTSKIRVFEDISSIYSYGFRGEALNSICAIAKNVTITTKTQQDPIGKQYELDASGSITGEKLANTIANTGTIIVVNQPFAHLPVRRRIIKKDSNATVKKIEALLITYGISNPNIRFSLVHHAKNNSWIKPTTNDIETSLRNVYGMQLADMLERHTLTEADDEEESPLTLDMMLPKVNSDPSVIYKRDHVFFFVNGRPINYVKSELKDVVIFMRQYYREAIGLNDVATTKKTPFMYIDIQIPPNEYDVNIEPNKSAVLFHNKQRIIDMIERVFKETYPKKIDVFFNQVHKGTHRIESLVTTNNQKQSDSSFTKAQEKDKTVEEMEISPPATALHSTRTNQIEEIVPPFAKRMELDEAAAPSSSRKNGTTPSWNFSMTDSEEIDQLADDNSDNEQSKGKECANPIQTLLRSPNIIPQTTQKSPPPPSANRSSNVTLHNTPTTSTHRNDDHHYHQESRHPSIQTTLTGTSKPIATTKSSSSSRITHSLEQSLNHPKANNRKRTYSSSSNHPPNITSMLKPKTSLSDHPTWNTLNNATLLTCDFESIKRNYESNYEYRAKYHHIRISDYLTMNRETANTVNSSKHITNLIKHPKLNEKGLAFYTRGVSADQPVYELGVMKIDELYSSTVYDALIKKHPLICKRNLERPVQLRIDINDPLYSVLILLQSKEQQIQDDLHGSTLQTYSVITDKRITHNGFNARWRKDDQSDCILVQLTSIYSLGSGYGVSDFRELLSKISQQPYDEENLECTRPEKVIRYYQSLSQKKYNSSDDTEKMQLNRGLESLQWNKHQDTNWMIGALNGKVQACVLTDQ